MDASDITRLLTSRHYSPADLDDVNIICRNYPEFTAAQMLKVRILEALGREKKKQLKLAAVYSMDRRKLFQLVQELSEPEEPETRDQEDTGDLIIFSDEPDHYAQVIIEEHAPYAGHHASTELLELEVDPSEELLEMDEPDKGSVDETGEDADTESVDETGEDADKESADETGEDADKESADETGEDADKGSADETGEDPGTDEGEDHLDSEFLIEAMVKDETDMEEPGVLDEEIPAIEPILEAKDKNHLIINFIKGDPGPIRADKETRLKGDVSLDSIKEHDGFITDTLARIYVKQGLFAKAIYAYEKLSLKYPEKSAYFAAQIEKIRNINHS
jgi:hypothetical protein